jgi:hypothetical protein
MTTAKKAAPLKFYWHIHHDTLCEGSTDIQERIDYIRKKKPAYEVPIRLKWLTDVKGKLPEEWEEADAKRREAYAKREEANAKWREAYAKREEAYAKWEEADAKWEEAYAKCRPQLEALHAEEHKGCPWDGRTLLS